MINIRSAKTFAGLCGMQRGRTDVAHTLARTKAHERSRRLSRLLGANTPRNSRANPRRILNYGIRPEQ